MDKAIAATQIIAVYPPKTAQGLRRWFLSREAEERGMLCAFRLTTTTRGGNRTAKANWFSSELAIYTTATISNLQKSEQKQVQIGANDEMFAALFLFTKSVLT